MAKTLGASRSLAANRARRAAEDDDEIPSREAVQAALERIRLQQIASPPSDYGPRGRSGPRGRNSRYR